MLLNATMKKISFFEHILPHGIALAVFLLVTVIYFKPFFFENKVISQHDIQQADGSVRTLNEYRDKTGEEPLWVNTIFSGMPAYMVSVKWSNRPVSIIKNIMSVGLRHPVANIFCAFVCFYILLLSFGVRPYLSIAGALAFGLSSYIIVGLIAGHNGRVGAMAFMPLVIAGIHVAFSGKKLLGFGVTATAIALHLRENHLQMTYYLVMIVGVYGLIQLIYAFREKRMVEFSKTLAVLFVAALVAAGTFFGQFWALTEYAEFSKRGKTELNTNLSKAEATGLTKEYAFEFSNGILEPLTLMLPNIYGGSSGNFLVQDQTSKVYNALVGAGNPQQANQLARYTAAYWGPQRLATPYYAGAVIVFLFALGVAFADKKQVWWLLTVSVLGIAISWGSNFAAFNYFLFDFVPGYNKFRSVTFALVIPLLAMPLLGFIGLEKVVQQGFTKEQKKKLLIVLASTGGLCLLLLVFGGMLSFSREMESQMPVWFTDALEADRKSLLRSDAFRSLVFIALVFGVIYFEVWKKLSPLVFYGFITVIILVDIIGVDNRYFTDDNYIRKRENTFYKPTEADVEVLKDKSYYRIYDIQEGMSEARSSNFHYSIGGYHGAKMRRYEDLYDSCLFLETNEFIGDVQSGKVDFSKYGIFNMLNVKYIMFGPDRNNVIPNRNANGNAWFVKTVERVKSPTEELSSLCDLNTRETAVMDESRFKIPEFTYDSAATIQLLEQTPKNLKYESNTATPGLALFSEIYYPKGWKATIDGAEAEILGANYILRALAIPAGKHTIEFRFEPAAYYVGNKITLASSWIALLALVASIGLSLFKRKE
jgi:hypothetical protein